MSEITKWQENNDRYLAAALAWLRLRLAGWKKGPSRALQPEPETKTDNAPGWFGKGKQPAPETAQPAVNTLDDAAKAEKAMNEAAESDPPPALVLLGERLGLSQFEREILLVCAAMELDTRIPALCSQAQNEPGRPYPTFALAFTIFDDPSWDALAAERPLRYWHLIEISQPGATPLTISALRADERIVNYLKGLSRLDDRLTPLLAPFDISPMGEIGLAPSHNSVAELIENDMRLEIASNRPPVIQLTGTDSVSKQQVALQLFSTLGMQGFRLPGELLPSKAGDLETLARLWQRESALLPLGLYIDAEEAEDGEGEGQPREIGSSIDSWPAAAPWSSSIRGNRALVWGSMRHPSRWTNRLLRSSRPPGERP